MTKEELVKENEKLSDENKELKIKLLEKQQSISFALEILGRAE